MAASTPYAPPMSSRPPELEYLRLIEKLAHEVVEQAAEEGWLEFGDVGQQAPTPLQRAVNTLATELRFRHHPDDGCLEQLEERNAP